VNEVEIRELHGQVRALYKSFRANLPQLPGTSASAVRVLGAVARGSGVQPSEIADELGMVSSNVASSLRELEAAGYVERRRSATDGRRVAVTLTPRGAEAVANHRSLRADGLREAIEAALSPAEQAQLSAAIPLLGKLVAAQRMESAL
jgi:DNA-binding MarR family transcriptional regulator